MSQRYAIASLQEATRVSAPFPARAETAECTYLVSAVSGQSIDSIRHGRHNMKFHSSMTLFAQAADQNREFVISCSEILQRTFSDQATLERLNKPRDTNTE